MTAILGSGLARGYAAPSGRRLWRLCLVIGLIAVAVPALITPMPPLLDYPNHVTRIWLLAGAVRQPPLSSMYAVDWSAAWTNVGVDLASQILGAVIPGRALGIWEGGLVPVDAGRVLYRFRAEHIIVATGTVEQPQGDGQMNDRAADQELFGHCPRLPATTPQHLRARYACSAVRYNYLAKTCGRPCRSGAHPSPLPAAPCPLAAAEAHRIGDDSARRLAGLLLPREGPARSAPDASAGIMQRLRAFRCMCGASAAGF